MQSRNDSHLKGIDISHYNGNINFSKVKDSGISVVMIKATEGTSFVDPMMKSYYNGAKANGLKVGFYHFFRTSASATAQAQHFVNTVYGLSNECKPVLDFEVTTVDKDTSSSYAKTFMDQIKVLTGQQCVFYTYTSFAKTYINSSLSVYPLWIAHYGVNTPGNNGIWSSWVGFQYSDSGAVNGISGNVDLDEFTEDIFVGSTVIPTPTPSNNALSISQVQAALNTKYNLSISVDNIFGSETLKAIIKGVQTELNVQFNKGLIIDGIFGPETKAALVTVKQGAQGNLTWLIQGTLICRGYSLSPYGTDGDFGNLTAKKVADFQKNNGLTVDSIVGKQTWSKLLS